MVKAVIKLSITVKHGIATLILPSGEKISGLKSGFQVWKAALPLLNAESKITREELSDIMDEVSSLVEKSDLPGFLSEEEMFEADMMTRETMIEQMFESMNATVIIVGVRIPSERKVEYAETPTLRVCEHCGEHGHIAIKEDQTEEFYSKKAGLELVDSLLAEKSIKKVGIK